MPQPSAQKNRRLAAVFAILLFALLPPLALVMPAVATAPDAGAAPTRLIVWLPQDRAGDLAAASATLDAADARPLAESRLAGVWLVAVRDADAPDRLYAGGARLVLSGDGLLAGCLGFRFIS